MFDPSSAIGRAYLDYVENRARIWAERYLDGREPDYRGDEVLRRHHFCNVWRELDRYSRWELSRLRAAKTFVDRLDVVVIGRLSMVPGTVRLLLAGAGPDEVRAYVRRRREAGLPWFSQALQIRCRAGADYVDMFCEHRDAYLALRGSLSAMVRSANDAQAAADAFSGVLPHVGPFRAYEIATSLTYFVPRFREDDLFHVGPGAVDGLEMLTGRRSTCRDDFEALRDTIRRALSGRTSFRWIPPCWQGGVPVDRKFTLRTLEDSLCEFRKYRAVSGLGSTARRRIYRRYDIEI